MNSEKAQQQGLLASKRVPKKEAKQWTRRWRNSNVLLSGNESGAAASGAETGRGKEEIIDKVYAFNIPIDDIISLLADNGIIDRESVKKEHEFKFIRTYLGIDKNGSGEFKNTDMKLLVVLTDKEGKDLLVKKSLQGATETEESEIFDLTSPCPDTCDDSSPLIGG